MSELTINKRIASIPASVTLGVTSKAKAMKAAGETVYSFAAGEPDFDTPEHIKAAAVQALADGQTKYAPVPGLPALRSAISNKLKVENGLNYAPEQIVVSCGAKHSLFNIIVALCDEGEEVIVPTPYWLSYPEMIRVSGATPVFVRASQDNDYKMTPEEFEAAITPKTKAIIFNSPSNPIGVVYNRSEIEKLVEIALRHNVYIIADEIYEKLLYDGAEHVSPGSLSPEAQEMVITVNGFSKAYSMTGWRLGYFAGPQKLVKAVNALQGHSTSSPSTFSQYGAVAALEGPQDCLKEMGVAFAERRNYIYDRVSAIDGITCVKPGGAFYVLPDISKFGLDSVAFAEKLLTEEGVAVVPGAPFGVDGNVRLSYACSMENIEKGLDGFERFIKSL
ncbi:MAG: pyridoxal phosphate-dependent aminotransferase [Kiritimatiellae bacterium]|nr:pyridoxal phosphate-dependent aminotransferase [Kiritimatiellia bacterium]